jgi:hypothetical protein
LYLHIFLGFDSRFSRRLRAHLCSVALDRPPAPSPGTHFTCFTGAKEVACYQYCSVSLDRPPAPSPGTQFACFTGTKVQILTQKLGPGAGTRDGPRAHRELEYKSTYADSEASTKVQILTQKLGPGAGTCDDPRAHRESHSTGTQFAGFTGTTVQILTQKLVPGCGWHTAKCTCRMCSASRYWHKSTNTDPPAGTGTKVHIP